jgi:hypothetical protein
MFSDAGMDMTKIVHQFNILDLAQGNLAKALYVVKL